jgi:hypothetical protein
VTMLSIKQAAVAMGVSYDVVRDLVSEAIANPKKARWKEGREFVDLSTLKAKKRLIRIRPSAVGLQFQPSVSSD